jgi:hypothetical protein
MSQLPATPALPSAVALFCAGAIMNKSEHFDPFCTSRVTRTHQFIPTAERHCPVQVSTSARSFSAACKRGVEIRGGSLKAQMTFPGELEAPEVTVFTFQIALTVV